MKSRTTLLILAIVVGLATGFWLYGMARTLRGTVNFDIATLVTSLLFGVVFPLLIVSPPLLAAKKYWFHDKMWPPPSWFVAFGVCLLVGGLASEGWILHDEARFVEEVSKTNNQVLYSRSRAWPYQNCSLVVVPGEGIHSID